ncbi:MAG: PKD domain-containing protein [Ferruginibacter sp.]
MRKILFFLGLLLISCRLFSQSISPVGPINLCSGENQLLTLTGAGSSNIQWQLNGGNIPGATSSTYTATASGTYHAVLTGPAGTSNNVIVTVHPNPVAGFSFSPNNQCSNIPVNFINTSTGAVSYQWNFGDPNSGSNDNSTAQNPTHTFIGTPGNNTQNFTITLIATSAFGCTITITHTVTTNQTPDLTLGGPGFVIYNNRKYFKICNNASSAVFTFTNQSTTAGTNSNYQIVWGDASPDFTSPTFSTPVTHTYNSGTSTLLFIVTGGNGCKDTATYYIFLGGNPAIGLGNPGNTSICTGSVLTFPITGGGANSPATVYTVSFNDGTASQVFPHPAPPSVSHNFLISSCGTNSPGYDNSFSASIQASNACASSTATVVPIYVSEKAPASFDIAPNDTVCVNTNVTLTNTTGANTNNDNGVCTPGKIVWKITPTTGWTVTSGITGNDFGLTDPSLWVNGTDILVLNYNTPGTYTIQLLTGNSICGADSITKTICVNPTPTGSFTLNQTTGCAPLTVNTVTTHNSPLCGVYTYQWTVSYSPTAGCVPSTSSITYLGGTSSTSVQPIFQFNNPGIYTIDLLIIAPAASCSTQVASQQVIVKGKPVVTLNPISGICQGQAINPGASATCYIDGSSTYLWSFPGGTPSSSTSANPGAIVYNSTGSQTVGLVVGNSCGTTSVSTPVAITITPVPNIPANISRCSGTSIGPLNLTSVTPGATILWTNNNTAIGLAASGAGSSIPVFTATNPGAIPITATITATATLNTCSSPASFTIIIVPIPLAPIVTSPVNYCQNATATALTATAAAGNSLIWYTTASGGTGTATAPIPTTTSTGTFLFYVSQVNTASGCEGPRALITVIVNPSPVILGNSHINPGACGTATGSITLTGLGNSVSYTVSYTFNGNPQPALTVASSAGGTLIIPNLLAGIYNNISVTSFGCPSNAIGPVTLSDPSTPATPTVGSNSPICSGNTLTLTASTTSPGVATYTWTGPNSFNIVAQNPTIPSAPAAASGTYFVTAQINNCTSLPGSVAVIVNPTPATPTIGSNSPVCTGNSLNLTSSVLFPAPLTYSWSGPNGFNSIQQNPTITNVTVAATGTYTVIITATAGNCPSPSASTPVIVNATPAISNGTSTNPSSCSSSTGSITLTGLVNNAIYTVNYTFNGSAQSQQITSSGTGTVIITNLPAGTYTNVYVTINGCSSLPVGPFILTDPTPPPTPVAGNTGPVCSGSTLTLTSTVAPAGATYNWTGPGGFTSSVQNPVINPAPLSAAGIYSLSVTLNACISATSTTTVVINETPATPIANNDGPVCTGSSMNLSASTTFGGPLTWSWTGPNGFTSNSSSPVITNITAAATGTYTVTATANTGNCTSGQANTVVVVNITPQITGSSFINPSSCSTPTGSITLTGLANNTAYSVHYDYNGIAQTQTITSSGTGFVVITGLPAGLYQNILVILNGCSSAPVGPYTLNDPTPPVTPVTGNNGPVCSGGSLTLTSTAAPVGATYNWTGPGGFVNAVQNPVINPASLSSAGMYSLSITLNACTSAISTTTVVVNETPSTPIANNNGPVCTGNTLNLSASTTFGGPLTWSWTGPNAFVSNSATPVISNITAAAAGTYTVTATATTGNCISAPATTIVVVNTTPQITGSSSINPSSCSSATGSITLTGLISGASYTVTYTLGGSPVTTTIVANASGQVIISNLSSGVYTNIAVNLLNCPSNTIVSITLVDPNPPAPPLAGSNSAICLNQTLNLTATSNAAGTLTYSWIGPNGFASGLQNPSLANAITAAAGMYYVNVQVNNCTSLYDSVLVVINPLGNLPVAASPVSYCKDAIAVALTANADPGNTLNWYTVATGGSALPAPPIPITTAPGATNYYVSQTTSFGCEGPRATVVVNINPDAIALFSPTDTIGCPQFQLTPAIVNLQLFPANNSTYEWYANGILIGTGAVFPGYTLLNENETVTIKLKAISLFGCKNDSMSRIFNTYNLPHPVFTKSDAVGCGPLIVQFQNTTANITQFTYLWDFGNGITSTLEQPGPITFQSSPTNNDIVYIIQLKVFSICDTLVYTDSVRVKSKPRALFTPSNTNGCSPMHVLFTNTSGGNNNVYHWNFDDGDTLMTTSDTAFIHTFHTGVIDTFHVQLLAVNECGADSITYDIITAPNNIHLNLSFNGTDASGCSPHTVAFINNTIGAGSFDWAFGDGSVTTTTDNIDTVYHTYITAGVFTVSVHAINNCTDTTAIRTITVYPTPSTAFTASSYNTCIGQQVLFTNQSVNANASQWQFGDGATSILVDPVHTYTTPGLYTVTLISYHNNPDGSACTDTLLQQVQVTATLPGNMTASATSGTCVPFTIDFTNNDTPSATANWDFGDGNTASGDNVSHTYTSPGVYTVTLVVTAPGGCTYTSTKIITITGPTGSLSYTGGFVCYPDPVRLEATATGFNNLLWDFGDGNTLTTTQLVVFHSYQAPGLYLPSVTLQSSGCNFQIQGLDTIKVDKIDAGFSWSTQQHCGYSNINFTDTSHVFFGESSVTWDFGDGTTGSGGNVTHQYTSTGIYNVIMVVLANSGCTDTVRTALNLHINNIPVVSIIGDPTRCANEDVQFLSNIVSADPVNITSWSLSNGATGSDPDFSYLFNIPGTYSLQLISGTVNGCFDTAHHTITINPVPVVTAGPGVTICNGGSVQLQATGPAPLQWTPIQGLSCTNCANPLATPVVTTPYVVSGSNNFGCFGHDTTVITVIQTLNITVSAADSICIGQSANLLASGASAYQWSPAIGLNSTVISNPTANPTVTTIYRVVGYDGYNCFTDTAYVLVAIGEYPTVNLGPDLTLATGTMQPLTSQVTNGPIAQWLWEPATDLSCADCAIPVAEIKHDINYKVTVTTAYGCQATDNINIKVFCNNSQVFIPNAFTPNGDGKNDVLMVRSKGIVSVRFFRIFNRWGEVVFERNNFPPNDPVYGWDGKINGKFAAPGVFVYTAEVICENGTPFVYKGNTTIIK